MSFSYLKARLGIGGRQRRYVDIESVRDLEDVSDPETTDDESKETLRERAKNHPVLAIVIAVPVTILFALSLFYLSRFAPGLMTNPWVHRGVVAGAIALFCYRRGWRAHRENVAEYDELVLKMGDQATTYKGVFLDDLPGRTFGFIPIKGWHKAGHEAVPYKNGDLGAAMVESFAAHKMEDDAAAVIKLLPGKDLAVTDTAHGKRVVQRTDGLKPYPDGNHTSLKVTHPTYDDKRARELSDQVESLSDENSKLRSELQALDRRFQNVFDRMNEPIDDRVKKRMQETAAFASAFNGRSGRQRHQSDDREDWQGTGLVDSQFGNGQTQTEQELEDVEEEVSLDDED